MSVRAKFNCVGVEPNAADPVYGTVRLEPVRDGSEENKQFFNMTPGGSISLSLLNPDAFSQFELGRDYYVDFSPATPSTDG